MVSGVNNKAVFFDRDGVLVLPEFKDGRSFAPIRFEDFEIYPEALDSLNAIKWAGFISVIVTNQPDVGKGIIAPSELDKMHEKLMCELPIDLIEVCPHTKEANCDCRKPKPGMLINAALKLGIALEKSYMIGDRIGDIAAGKAAGCKTIFIDLEYEAEPKPLNQDYTVASVSSAVACILNALN
ncbi:HAD family hydrolase [Paracoccaceae bacterium]|jgi:D-glycero-D-manno-heptose 1,7-bisphosphate phosphatase|nr:HAD family hydrolase [Paracoccaceae bacterium]